MQYLDALVLDFCRLASLELAVEPVTGSASPFRRTEVLDNCFDEGIRSWRPSSPLLGQSR